jgi:FkbH-like protein
LKLTEALKITQQLPANAASFAVTLACGLTPLHLKTFLTAYLLQALPGRKVVVEPGLYGNLVGTVEGNLSPDLQAIAIALEWADLDQRLGYRQTGGWSPADVADIAANLGGMLQRLEAAIQRIRPSTKVVVSLPTLALPPVFTAPSWQSSEAEMRLELSLAHFASSIARLQNVSIVSRRQIDEVSPRLERFDLKADALTGLSYKIPHADHLAASFSRLICPTVPKKGLITDLDDTLWRGIVGEVGAGSVFWDLESHSQIHGLYQQLLRALADQGVLIAVASKNSLDVAQRAFARPDILLSSDKIFPFEVHWQPKSGSVERILRAWNVGADSVVFVDDSPMELAEVQAAHPGVQCILFPKGDYAAVPAFLRTLRDLFGKARVGEEDALRLQSIRRGAEFREASNEATPDAFLEQMKARIKLDFSGAGADPRSLELVNKTNQFNLNGWRLTETDWAKELDNPNTFVVSVGYEDKFGSLGKVAVLLGKRQGSALHVPVWVMSCRAFARRIEHLCLRVLFDRFHADSIVFDFEATSKNAPIQEFLGSLLAEKPLSSPLHLSRQAFDGGCPVLYHEVTII